MAFNLQSIKDVFSKIGAGIQKLPEQANRDWLQGGLVQNNPLIPNVAKPIIKPVVQVGPAPFIANYAKAAGSLVDPNQNLIQRAGNVAGAVYQNVHPFQTMAGGLMGVPFNYAANAIQNTIAGKPINQNFNPISAYQQGFEFQSKLGPAEKLVSPVTGPILNGLIKSDKYLPQILKAGFKGGIPMSIVGFAEPAKNMQEAFGNALSSFAQGFVFSGVTKGVEIPATKIWNNVKASIRMSKPNASEQEITREGVRYIMTESGKLAGSRPKTKEPEFYGDVRERLGLPRTGIEPPQVGMTTKEVTPQQRAKMNAQPPLSDIKITAEEKAFQKYPKMARPTEQIQKGGFITTDGKLVEVNDHTQSLTNLGFKEGVRGQENLNNYLNKGGIRTVTESNGTIGIELHKAPTAQQLQALENFPSDRRFNLDLYKGGWETGLLNSKTSLSKTEAIDEIKRAYNVVQGGFNDVAARQTAKQNFEKKFYEAYQKGKPLTEKIEKPVKQIAKEPQLSTEEARRLAKMTSKELSEYNSVVKNLKTPSMMGTTESGVVSSFNNPIAPKTIHNQIIQPPRNVVQQPVGDVTVKPPVKSEGVPNEAQRLNVNKLNLPNEQRLNVREAENALNTPKTTMTNESVLEKAKSTVGAQSAVQMEDTLAKAAKSHATMQNVVDLQNKFDQLKTSGASDAELKQAFRALGEKAHVARSIRTEHGRLLQADKIMADAASTPMQKVMSLLDNAGVDLKKVEDDAIKVNWDNANEVIKFYRKFVKPSFREVLDEYRYNNMLSGLGTQIRNNYSNLIQTIFTRPATKLVSGDVKGTVKYYQGLAKSLSDAGKAASKSFKGMESSQKLDFKQIKTGKLPRFMTAPSDAMEAADKFWMTLIKGGETNAGKTSQQAEQIAKYSLFRNELDPKNKSGQGDLLSALDALTARISELRNPIKIGKREYPNPVGWFVPFIKTGTQIGKQWLEFTPGAGMATLPGNTNKKEQLAKQLIGLVPMIIGADLAMQGRTTWQAPTDPKQKEEFYASGRKPMSIRMGDTWVPMEYFGPLAVALALPAAHNYYFNEAPDAITSGTDAKIAKTLMAGMQLYTQQSWMSGLGNFINLARGDVQDYSIPQNLAFTAGQFKPYSGLMASVARLVDPIYRKAQGFGQAFIRDIPLASRSLPAYTNPAGEESTRLFRNNILPYQVGKVDETFERGYQNRSQQLQYNRIVTRSENVKDEIKALLKQGKTEEANALIKKNMDILKQGAITGNIKKKVDKYQGYRKKVIDSPLPPAKKKELLNLIDKQLAMLLKQTESLVIPTNKI